jgi:lysophospholipase L1-like esterase
MFRALSLWLPLALLCSDNKCCGAQAGNHGTRATLPAQVKRVLFLGDSITYSGTYVALVEAYFLTRYPDRVIEFINLGLPSETVSGLSEEGHAGGQFPRPDLHERLERVLKHAKPDLVFACYGMNDGIYLPLNEERFAKFREGISWLHAKVTGAGALLIHVTPPTFDEMKGGHAGYSATLAKYSEWLLRQRKLNDWDVVDVHGPMDAYLAYRRKSDADFAYAGDGVHANELGHWIIAKQILLHLGAHELGDAADGKAMLKDYPHGQQLLKLVQQRQDIMKDAWLNATGHKRPGMNHGMPLPEAMKTGAEIEKEIRTMLKDSDDRR